ncbi:2Fe-2S iron-sulfur cluster-binding protein [Streptomyces sp. NPDC090029]|uniref:2Fe-2S iron-sulfur cluster-binding protein n=1 Tax=Streptomyces sp. NPDC090029 TaxID=3365924 RepID=UPI003821E1F4
MSDEDHRHTGHPGTGDRPEAGERHHAGPGDQDGRPGTRERTHEDDGYLRDDTYGGGYGTAQGEDYGRAYPGGYAPDYPREYGREQSYPQGAEGRDPYAQEHGAYGTREPDPYGAQAADPYRPQAADPYATQGHGQSFVHEYGSWQPTTGPDYDGESTTFLQLPPEGPQDAAPLEAPGHGYTPPMITPLKPLAPRADGNAAPVDWQQEYSGPPGRPGPADEPAAARDAAPGQDPLHAGPEPHASQDPHAPREPEDPQATGQWSFAEESAPREPEDSQATGQWSFPEEPAPRDPAAAHEMTGQWSVPIADGDLPEESGEYPRNAVPGTAPAAAPTWTTLPGGAPAPWAQPDPDPLPEAPEATPGAPAQPLPDGAAAPEATPEPGPVPVPESEPGPAPVAEHPAAEGTAVPGDASAPTGGDRRGAPSGEAHPAPEAPDDPSGAPEGGPPEPESLPADRLPDEGPAPVADSPALPAEPPAPEPDAQAPTEAPADSPPAEEEMPGAPVPPPRTEAAPALQDLPGQVPHTAAAPEPLPVLDPADAPPLPGAGDEHPAASYVLTVNGADRPVTDAWIGESLLYVLRERLGLAGAKDGCSQGECGACNVQVDGRLVASCLVPAATTAGSEIRTVEGLATHGEPSDVQRALARCGAVQCGFCIPGMAMTVHDLLEGNHAPSELETRRALSGNLCRCTGYQGVLSAVREVVADRAAAAEAPDGETADQRAGSAPDEARVPHQAPPGEGSAQPHPHDGGMA